VASKPSVRVVKQFNYRGAVRTYSNRYHFDGGTPADAAHWLTLTTAIFNAERLCFRDLSTGGVLITDIVGYAGGSEIPVYTHNFNGNGTGAPANWVAVPGDVAALVRYSTSAHSSKNHPIYLFNYYHAVGYSGTTGTSDDLNPAQSALFATYAAHWVTGFSDGTNNYVRCGPDGNVATGSLVEPMLTHRDLPR